MTTSFPLCDVRQIVVTSLVQDTPAVEGRGVPLHQLGVAQATTNPLIRAGINAGQVLQALPTRLVFEANLQAPSEASRMAIYQFDWLSPRGIQISREDVECAEDQEAVVRALAILAGDRVPSHVEVWLIDRLVWSSRRDTATSASGTPSKDG